MAVHLAWAAAKRLACSCLNTRRHTLAQSLRCPTIHIDSRSSRSKPPPHLIVSRIPVSASHHTRFLPAMGTSSKFSSKKLRPSSSAAKLPATKATNLATCKHKNTQSPCVDSTRNTGGNWGGATSSQLASGPAPSCRCHAQSLHVRWDGCTAATGLRYSCTDGKCGLTSVTRGDGNCPTYLTAAS